ncbi:MAG: BamA/TamA family outer membrane protein [Chlamydiae bacterium]|nr:BamA/TamA family outer membrane protein [Chlamydiota bacterium]
MKKQWIYPFLAFVFFQVVLYGKGISYSVQFEGIPDEEVLKAVESVSQLVALKKRHPPSLNSLRYRAESDIPVLIKILQNYGYYEAEIKFDIEEEFDGYTVILKAFLGPRYLLENYQIKFNPKEPDSCCFQFALPKLDICLGRPAIAETILNAELKLLELLSECGFPLATIKKREFIADGKTKTLRVELEIDTGNLAHFGEIKVQGLKTVKSIFVYQYISWKRGEVYSSRLVEKTQQALIDTALFNSVHITHGQTFDEHNQLPINIELTESKHRSISVGASFQTTYGPGVTFGWEHRNISGMGRKLQLQAELSQRGFSGIASYLIPHFFYSNQEYLIQAQAILEEIRAYHDRSYSLFNRFYKQISPNALFSLGIKFERLLVTSSVDNGSFWLIEIPLYFKWTNEHNRLNPTKGITFEYKAYPSFNFAPISQPYLSQTFAFSSYIPLMKNEFLILAQKITVGSIWSRDFSIVPIPKRFFGGSEENLRGYRYFTVSPLKDDKPKGGRSAVYYTLEPRFRVTKSIGLVPFFDMGNVYSTVLPSFKGKWVKSIGMGFRYFTFFGPLRLDLAFPLNRRAGLDPAWWVFVSLGQTF